MTKPREADVQRLILDWLAAKKIWHIRLNTGAMSGSHKGKRWFVKFGKPGMADIVVMPRISSVDVEKCYDCGAKTENTSTWTYPTWIEVKSPVGKQSPEQKRFREEVESQGMQYILARSLEDVKKVLEAR